MIYFNDCTTSNFNSTIAYCYSTVNMLVFVLFYFIPAKEINKEWDEKIKKEPEKSDLFNTIRYIELRYFDDKAEKHFALHLKKRTEEQLMWMDKEDLKETKEDLKETKEDLKETKEDL